MHRWQRWAIGVCTCVCVGWVLRAGVYVGACACVCESLNTVERFVSCVLIFLISIFFFLSGVFLYGRETQRARKTPWRLVPSYSY